MPKKWDRSQYPDDWEEISRRKREEAGWTCEFCGAEHQGQSTSKGGSSYTVRVAAAHKWPRDTRNPDPDLYCLCQSCHFSYDNQFQNLMEEGEHQARMHEIALEQELKYYDDCALCDRGGCRGHYE